MASTVLASWYLLCCDSHVHDYHNNANPAALDTDQVAPGNAPGALDSGLEAHDTDLVAGHSNDPVVVHRNDPEEAHSTVQMVEAGRNFGYSTVREVVLGTGRDRNIVIRGGIHAPEVRTLGGRILQALSDLFLVCSTRRSQKRWVPVVCLDAKGAAGGVDIVCDRRKGAAALASV